MVQHRESKAHPNDGKRLFYIRKHARLSQNKFASLLGVSKGTIRSYEIGRTEIRASTSRAVLGLFGVNPVSDDPEEDPWLVLVQMKNENASSELAERSEADPVDPVEATELAPKGISHSIKLLGLRSRQLRESIYSPFRKRLHECADLVYLIATFSFVNEHLRRTFFDDGIDPSAYRDFIYVSSFLLIVQLVFVLLFTLPWGMKFDLNSRTVK